MGHPGYSDYLDEELEFIKGDVLDMFEDKFRDYTLISMKVDQWRLKEGPRKGVIDMADDLEEEDVMIAVEYVWPTYLRLRRECAAIRAQLVELQQEQEARAMADYFTVCVDRGMLRTAFEEQVGYDNQFLFDEADLAPEA